MAALDNVNQQQFYHVAPEQARSDIAKHGIDYTRSSTPDYDVPAGAPPRANYFHNTLDAAKDMQSYMNESAPHDLYSAHVTSPVTPDPWQPEDAVYTKAPVPPNKIKRL